MFDKQTMAMFLSSLIFINPIMKQYRNIFHSLIITLTSREGLIAIRSQVVIWFFCQKVSGFVPPWSKWSCDLFWPDCSDTVSEFAEVEPRFFLLQLLCGTLVTTAWHGSLILIKSQECQMLNLFCSLRYASILQIYPYNGIKTNISCLVASKFLSCSF